MDNWYDLKSQSVGTNQQYMDHLKIQMRHHQQHHAPPSSAFGALASASNDRRNYPHLYNHSQQQHPMNVLSMMSPRATAQQSPLLLSSFFFNKTRSLLSSRAQASHLHNLATVASTTSRALEMARTEKLHGNMSTSGGDDFGVVESPTTSDVLLGRGGRSNHHVGNERYRELIRNNRERYSELAKHEKIKLSRAIVGAVYDLGGRFLEPTRYNGAYEVISNKRAVEKTSQCLREKRVGPRGESKAAAAARAARQVGTTSKAA